MGGVVEMKARARPETLGGGGFVREPLRALRKALRRVRGLDGSRRGDGAARDAIHQLRVSCRRLAVALDASRGVTPERVTGKFSRVVRKLRNSGGVVRDCDVHLELLAQMTDLEGEARQGAARMIRRIEKERTGAMEELVKEVSGRRGLEVDELSRKLLRIEDDGGIRDGGEELRRREVVERWRGVVAAKRADLWVLPRLHELRLAIKGLRYAMMLLDAAGDERVELAIGELGEFQRRLGDINDAETLLARLMAPEQERRAVAGLASLIGRCTHARDLRHQGFMAWWAEEGRERLEEVLARIDGTNAGTVGAVLEIKPATVDGERAGNVEGLRLAIAQGRVDERAGVETRRVGVIDVGSASVRLLVADTSRDGSYVTVDRRREMTRLGDSIARRGKLGRPAIRKTLEAVAKMAERARDLECDEVHAFATAAVREASNSREFSDGFLGATGLRLETLSEEDEGRLAHGAAASVFDLSKIDAVVFDLGGGSLELVHSHRGTIVSNVSAPLGAVRLTDAFGGAKSGSAKRLAAMGGHVERTLAGLKREDLAKPGLVIGVGGTLTTLAAMAAGLRGESVEAEGSSGSRASHRVRLEEVRAILGLVRATPLERRSEIKGLAADRVDIIVAGLLVVERVLRSLGVDEMQVSPVGIREGMVLKLAHAFGEEEKVGRRVDPIETVREFAESCGYERAHCERVRRLALSLFDQVEGPAGDRERERKILEAAAVVHDVGIAVSYRSHHKHSYAMMINADLAGWTQGDQRLAAVVGRYHRRAEPSVQHAEFAALTRKERRLVRRLAGILRVADGLDRSHTQNTRDVRVEVRGKSVRLLVDATTNPRLDLKASKAKAGMFERVMGRKVRYRWVADGP